MKKAKDANKLETEVEIDIKLVLYSRYAQNLLLANKWVLDYTKDGENKYHLECDFFARPKGYLKEVLDLVASWEGKYLPEKLQSTDNRRSQSRNLIKRFKDAWVEFFR